MPIKQFTPVISGKDRFHKHNENDHPYRMRRYCRFGRVFRVSSAGPTTTEVFNQAQKNGQVRFSLVEVDNGVVDALAKRRVVGPSSVFARYKKPPSPTIGVAIHFSLNMAVDWRRYGLARRGD